MLKRQRADFRSFHGLCALLALYHVNCPELQGLFNLLDFLVKSGAYSNGLVLHSTVQLFSQKRSNFHNIAQSRGVFAHIFKTHRPARLHHAEAEWSIWSDVSVKEGRTSIDATCLAWITLSFNPSIVCSII